MGGNEREDDAAQQAYPLSPVSATDARPMPPSGAPPQCRRAFGCRVSNPPGPRARLMLAMRPAWAASEPTSVGHAIAVQRDMHEKTPCRHE
jgi:hypothetical protein